MKVFNLPDLGEGLPDAEIVEWLVEEGDVVELDQPMVSMETAKAVVEVPSPYAGKVVKFHGAAGDVIQTGAPLAEFQLEDEADADGPDADQPAEATPAAPEPESPAEPERRAAADVEPESVLEFDAEDEPETGIESDSDTDRDTDTMPILWKPSLCWSRNPSLPQSQRPSRQSRRGRSARRYRDGGR